MSKKYQFRKKNEHIYNFCHGIWLNLYTRIEYFDIMINTLVYCRKIKEWES